MHLAFMVNPWAATGAGGGDSSKQLTVNTQAKEGGNSQAKTVPGRHRG